MFHFYHISIPPFINGFLLRDNSEGSHLVLKAAGATLVTCHHDFMALCEYDFRLYWTEGRRLVNGVPAQNKNLIL